MSDIRERVERYYSGKFAEHGPSAPWRRLELAGVPGASVPSTPPDRRGDRFVLARRLRVRLRRACRATSTASASTADTRDSISRHRWSSTRAPPIRLDLFTTRSRRPSVGRLRRREWDLQRQAGCRQDGCGADTSSRRSPTSRSLGTKGFAFNMLTSYSDADKMRDDLYYGDPCELFDHCKRSYSRNVALLHDYGLYEFTMLVRA